MNHINPDLLARYEAVPSTWEALYAFMRSLSRDELAAVQAYLDRRLHSHMQTHTNRHIITDVSLTISKACKRNGL